MRGSHALDTNVVIALLNDEPEVVRKWQLAQAVLLPAPVNAELLYGALRSGRPEENVRRVQGLLQHMELIVCDRAVCERHAQVRSSLAAMGRPIPENDVWVAACAQAAGATLVTRDQHFTPVTDLQLAEW